MFAPTERKLFNTVFRRRFKKAWNSSVDTLFIPKPMMEADLSLSLRSTDYTSVSWSQEDRKKSHNFVANKNGILGGAVRHSPGKWCLGMVAVCR